MKIVGIDDFDMVHDILESLFARTPGRQYFAAETGEEGVILVYEKRPDLILLDYNMPGMNGVQVYDRVKDNPETKDIPIISIGDFPENFLQNFEANLHKPFRMNDIETAVQEALDRNRSIEF